MSWLTAALLLHTEPMAVTGVRLSDRSPDEGLGSSIAAPLGSLRSSLSRRIESNDTDRSVDIIESSEADRATDIIEGGDADLGADVTVDIATTTNSTKEPDANILPDTEGIRCLSYIKKVKVKEGHTLKEHRRGAYLPFIGH